MAFGIIEPTEVEHGDDTAEAALTRDEALALLRGGPGGVERWNQWRQRNQELPDLRHADLQFADLRGADLAGARLQHTNFAGAALARAVFERADLNHCNMRWVDLRGGVLRSADLRGVNFYGADLRGVDLRHARVRNTSFTGARSDASTRTDGFPINELGARRRGTKPTSARSECEREGGPASS